MMVVAFDYDDVGSAAVPKVTVAPVAKFVPVMVTAVPPAVDPVFGDTLVTVGGAR